MMFPENLFENYLEKQIVILGKKLGNGKQSNFQPQFSAISIENFAEHSQSDDYDSYKPNSMAGRFFNRHQDLNQEDDNNNVC